jgi:hypothetical protein
MLLKQVWPYEDGELDSMVEVADVVVVLDVGVAVVCEVEEDDLYVVEEADVVLTELQSPNSGWLYTQFAVSTKELTMGIRRKKRVQTR